MNLYWVYGPSWLFGIPSPNGDSSHNFSSTLSGEGLDEVEQGESSLVLSISYYMELRIAGAPIFRPSGNLVPIVHISNALAWTGRPRTDELLRQTPTLYRRRNRVRSTAHLAILQLLQGICRHRLEVIRSTDIVVMFVSRSE
jgi:hypothetical protein